MSGNEVAVDLVLCALSNTGQECVSQGAESCSDLVADAREPASQGANSSGFTVTPEQAEESSPRGSQRVNRCESCTPKKSVVLLSAAAATAVVVAIHNRWSRHSDLSSSAKELHTHACFVFHTRRSSAPR